MRKRKPEDELTEKEEEEQKDVVESSGDEGDEELGSEEEDEYEAGGGSELDEEEGEEEDEDDEDGGEDGDELDDGMSGSDIDDLIQDDEFEGVSGSDVSDAEEKKEEEKKKDEDSGIGSAFGRAFDNIMKKKVPKSELTDSLGPVLAERKQLLVKKLEEEENEKKVKTDSKKKKREEKEQGHTLPQTYTDAKEKALIKLATTGVVRLFNAVSKAQKVQADADISSSQAAKATWKQSKKAFMTQLRGGPKDEKRPVGGTEKTGEEEQEEAGWSALKDDFMLGTSKMKDWDKNMEDVDA